MTLQYTILSSICDHFFLSKLSRNEDYAGVKYSCSISFYPLKKNLLECYGKDKQTELCRHMRQTHPAQHLGLSREMSVKMW